MLAWETLVIASIICKSSKLETPPAVSNFMRSTSSTFAMHCEQFFKQDFSIWPSLYRPRWSSHTMLAQNRLCPREHGIFEFVHLFFNLWKASSICVGCMRRRCSYPEACAEGLPDRIICTGKQFRRNHKQTLDTESWKGHTYYLAAARFLEPRKNGCWTSRKLSWPRSWQQHIRYIWIATRTRIVENQVVTRFDCLWWREGTTFRKK